MRFMIGSTRCTNPQKEIAVEQSKYYSAGVARIDGFTGYVWLRRRRGDAPRGGDLRRTEIWRQELCQLRRRRAPTRYFRHLAQGPFRGGNDRKLFAGSRCERSFKAHLRDECRHV